MRHDDKGDVLVTKLDLVKSDKAYYRAKPAPELGRFGPINYLTCEGEGAPAGADFVDAAGALHQLAYGLKKHYKQKDRDYAVPSFYEDLGGKLVDHRMTEFGGRANATTGYAWRDAMTLL